MGALSIWKWLIVLLVVALIFGTSKLRNLGKDVGVSIKGFKDAMKEEEGDIKEIEDKQENEVDQGAVEAEKSQSQAESSHSKE